MGLLLHMNFEYTIDNSTGFIEGEMSDKFRIQFSFLSTLAGKEKGNANLCNKYRNNHNQIQ